MRKKRIIDMVINPLKLVRPLGARGFLNWMSDETYIKLAYKGEIGEKLNLKSPVTFNEKIQWLKLNDNGNEFHKFVDKFEVRKYVSEIIGDKYLIPIVGVYDNFNEIEWGELPESFVLKCTHGSHCHTVCMNKNNFDIKEEKRKFEKWLNTSWFWFGREKPYKKIKPRIVCEEFISELNDLPSDYKVMCFNGKPRILQLHKKNLNGDHTIDFYDVDTGDRLPIKKEGFKNSNQNSINPDSISDLIGLASKLSNGFKYLRTDFYKIEERIYFGEMTFYDSSGFINFEPNPANIYLGELLDLGVVNDPS